LPAVTVPPARNGVGSFASASRLVSRGCSSTVHPRGLAALRRNGDADDLRGEVARFLRGERALLAAQRELVLILARDAKIVGDVLSGLRHRVDAVRAA
jgi:hypothetical protein